ncbi:MAG: hypothetical protein EA379_10565 [Phycisphaerales bacterium]|nr:MAG: hypothetical protein EA379_10565 [Phycisphaerales bacterium]
MHVIAVCHSIGDLSEVFIESPPLFLLLELALIHLWNFMALHFKIVRGNIVFVLKSLCLHFALIHKKIDAMVCM